VGEWVNPTVFLNPLQVVLQALATVTFVATIAEGFSGTIAWAVDGIAGGNSTVGTISGSGVYVAPAGAGLHVVTATATVGDFTPFANAAINVITSAQAAPVTVQTTAPTGTAAIGTLVFDSTTAVLYIYTSTGWVVA
jgi:hypothetical protein